jgi:hypothetical protein
LLCGIRHVGQTATSTTLEVKPAVRIRVDQDIRLDPKIRVYPVSTLGYSITYRLVTLEQGSTHPADRHLAPKGAAVLTQAPQCVARRR